MSKLRSCGVFVLSMVSDEESSLDPLREVFVPLGPESREVPTND